MKLKNKLLPLVGISAVAATVAPIALTSCSSKESMIDLLTYESKFESTKPSVAVKTEIEAAKLYYGNDKAAEILKDDMLYFLAYNTAGIKQYEYLIPAILGYDCQVDMQKAEANISGLEIQYTDKTNKAKCSGTIHLALVSDIYKSEGEKTEANKIGQYVLETKHVVKNLPYTLWYNNDQSAEPGKLANGFTPADLIAAKADWSITRSYTGTLTYKDNSEPIEYETQSENWYKEMLSDDLTEVKSWIDSKLIFLQFTSNYLYNLKKS